MQNAKFLEKLHLSVGLYQGLVGLLSSSTSTLKVLDLTLFLPLEGLCEELEAMEGHMSYEIHVLGHEAKGSIGSPVREVLVNPGWSALKRISVKSLNRWSWEQRQSCQWCYSLYPINISVTLQNSIPSLSTTQ